MRAVIFDFDGLLMDTESTSLQSWQWLWRQWDVELDPATFFADHGGDVTDDRFRLLAAAVGDGFDRDGSHERRLAYRRRLHESLDLADGIRCWIEQAADTGVRLAVASSSPRGWVVEHLERAGVLAAFDVVATGDEVEHHKPAPDVYELALRRLGLVGRDAVAVEDTPHGVRAAQAAGLRCIAIPNPFVRPEAVAHAQLVLRSAAQLDLQAATAAALVSQPA